ncbi:hypothetical protein MRX96_032819 [Rhipicephalus microplus]
MPSSKNEAPAANPSSWASLGVRRSTRRFDFSASGRSADLIQFLGRGGEPFLGRADWPGHTAVRATLPQGDNAKLSPPAGTPRRMTVSTQTEAGRFRIPRHRDLRQRPNERLASKTREATRTTQTEPR